jgi:glycosyltransferase involved in cell wall biosynthesis
MTLYLIDITRTISRIDRGLATGIDRVELAYINYLVALHPETLFVARLGRHSVLFDVPRVKKILKNILVSHDWGRPTLTDSIRLKLSWEQRCARSYLKRNCLSKAGNGKVGRLFGEIDLTQYQFLNVGHSNLTDTMFGALKAGGCPNIRVFIHDMIPLDYPEFSKSHIPKAFEKRMRSVARNADQIICNSEETSRRVQYYFRKWGAEADCLVAYLGIEPRQPVTSVEKPVDRPYFVILGTIEPRKNHMLLFRVWERMAAERQDQEMPLLFVVGRRGWVNAEVFQFLDESMLAGRYIFEENNLDDQSLTNLLTHANALLFPSFVEGFGLPALEAAQIGIPVYCSDIRTFREVLGEAGIYLDPGRIEQWQEKIIENIENPQKISENPGKLPNIPTWKAHFRHVFG